MSRFFAIIPAAGNSSRMGEPKLLLPMDGGTMIEKTIAAWKSSRVDRVVVVVRPDDRELAEVCRTQRVEVVIPPLPPPEMKDSVQHGLNHIEAHFAPTSDDAWLLAPADMPNLSSRIINQLVASFNPCEQAILIPTMDGQRGHPVLFPWTFATEVNSLAADEGLNVLRRKHGSREVPCDETGSGGINPFVDVDTPEDYQRAKDVGRAS